MRRAKNFQSVIGETSMYRQAIRFPEQIEFALNTLVFNLKSTENVAICGMGTCSIAGEIVSDYMDGMGKACLPVIKGIELPKWVGSNTTVICISYSGNTQETLHIYRSAVRKGAQVVCITSGGMLEDLCIKDGNVLLSMPGGFESRGALGYMVGFIATILVNIGILDSIEDFENALPAIKSYRDSFIKTDDNEAFDIAKYCFGRIPIIYSFFNMRSVASRWKSQLNENSKLLSFSGTIPEFNHNELVGWTGDLKTEYFVPIIILDDGASKMLKYMVETPVGMLMEAGKDVYIFHINGKNILEKTLKAIIAGDLVSLYLAHLSKNDPANTDVVEQMKELIEKDQFIE